MSSPRSQGISHRVAQSLFFFAFSIAGLISLYALWLGPKLEFQAAQSWISTPCEIIEGEIESRSGESGTQYRAKIRFRFEFEGNERQGSRLDQLGRWGEQRQQREILNRYPVGHIAQCLVNPDYPADTVLELAEVPWQNFAFSMLFMLTGLVGLFGEPIYRRFKNDAPKGKRITLRAESEILFYRRRTLVWVQSLIGLFFSISVGYILIIEEVSGARGIQPHWKVIMGLFWLLAVLISITGIRELIRPQPQLFSDGHGLWIRPQDFGRKPYQIPWPAIESIEIEEVQLSDSRHHEIEIRVDAEFWQAPKWLQDAERIRFEVSTLAAAPEDIHQQVLQRWRRAPH